MDILQEISHNLRKGNEEKLVDLVKKALDANMNYKVILNKGLFVGMQTISNLFKEEKIFVPEVLMAAKAMEAGQKVLEPFIVKDNISKDKRCKVVLGTVRGDVHNLGKDLIDMMLRGAGFEVINLGVDISEEKFVESIKKERPKILGMSALLTTTMPYMRTTIEALKKTGLRDVVKIIIGGACVTQQYADEIGADAYADNAGTAVEKIRDLAGIS